MRRGADDAPGTGTAALSATGAPDLVRLEASGPATAAPQGARSPLVLVVGGILSVQVGASVAKNLFPSLGAGGTVLLRLAISALLLLVLARRSLRLMTRESVRPVVSLGVVLGVMNFTFYESLQRIPLGVAVTIEFLGPLSLAVLGAHRVRDYLWPLLAAGGVVVLTDGGSALVSGDLDPVGALLALAAGVCWAAYIGLSQRVGAVLPGVTGLAVALTVGAVVVAPFGIVQGGTALFHPGLLAAGAAVAVLSSAIPYACEMAALRQVAARTFGVLMSLEPAAAALVGLIVLSEAIGWTGWVGIALVCVASAGATRAAPPDAAGP